MVKTKGVRFEYDKNQAFQFPDFELNAKDQMLIVGESGCGKTTLLHLLSGLLTPKAGEVWIEDTKINALSGSARDRFRGKNIGLVYQRSIFLEALSVRENLLLSPYVTKAVDKEALLADMTKPLGIHDLLDKKTYQLSVGEQQRVGIARAFMTKPKLILADEPTSALDNRNCEAVVRLLQEQAANADAALIIVTHDDRLKSRVDNILSLPSKALAS